MIVVRQVSELAARREWLRNRILSHSPEPCTALSLAQGNKQGGPQDNVGAHFLGGTVCVPEPNETMPQSRRKPLINSMASGSHASCDQQRRLIRTERQHKRLQPIRSNTLPEQVTLDEFSLKQDRG